MQCKSRDEEIGSDIESGIRAIKGAGHPLPDLARNLFESRFGADFNHVRIHTDTQAEETARSINARAFTLGRNIIFGRGQYASETTEGRRLLAHELAHVVQQGRAGAAIQRAPVPGASPDPQKASSGGSSPAMPGGDYYGQALSEAKRSGYGEAARLPDAQNMFLYFKLWDRLDEVKKHMWEIRIAFLTWGRDFHNAEDEYRKNLYGILADLRDFAKEYDQETGRFHLFEHERTAAVRQKVQESIERLDKFLLERDLLVTDLFKEEREVQSQDEKISEQIEQLDRILDDIYNRRFTGGPAISKVEYNSIMSRLIAISQQADPADRKMRDLMERYLDLYPGHGNP